MAAVGRPVVDAGHGDGLRDVPVGVGEGERTWRHGRFAGVTAGHGEPHVGQRLRGEHNVEGVGPTGLVDRRSGPCLDYIESGDIVIRRRRAQCLVGEQIPSVVRGRCVDRRGEHRALVTVHEKAIVHAGDSHRLSDIPIREGERDLRRRHSRLTRIITCDVNDDGADGLCGQHDGQAVGTRRLGHRGRAVRRSEAEARDVVVDRRRIHGLRGE